MINKIEAGNARYLSEVEGFQEGLPHGVLNKVKTDVGGTFCAMNCDSNYIIIVPFTDLVESIENDSNTQHNVFGVRAGVNKSQFDSYLFRESKKKIAVTWDSFPRLIQWLEDNNQSLIDYKLLIDEYHLILEDMDFRYDAVDGLMSNIKKFNHYTFLSATPSGVEFETDLIKALPHYEVVWSDFLKVRTIRGKSNNVYKSVVSLIESYENGIVAQDIYGKQTKVEELYIFMNSVTGIKQVCDTLELNPADVKICCAERRRNKLMLGDYEIESVSNPNKKINFFTKKSFQGCNLFSNNGLIVVVSDARREHTLVDVSTTMEQIVGRLRTNHTFKNCFSDLVVHIFSTNSNIPSDEEFSSILSKKDIDAENMLSIQSKVTAEELKTLTDKLTKLIESEVVSIIDGKIVKNELKRQSFIYKQELKKSYKDGLSIRNKFNDSDKFIASNQRDFSAFDVLLSKITVVSYKDLYEDFINNYHDDSIRREHLNDNPEFELIKDYVSETEANSLKWVKDKLIKRAEDNRDVVTIAFNFIKRNDGKTISRADVKKMLDVEFKNKGLKVVAKSTMILESDFGTITETNLRIDGKRVPHYQIKSKY